jgi:cobalt-zinc-cadmium efflux system protein
MTSSCHGHTEHGHSHGKFVQISAKNSADQSLSNIRIAFTLNLVFAVVELVGGWLTNSVAIQADAIHDFGDSLVLLAALVLQYWSNATARGRFTFGFKRLSLLSAFAASLVILLGSIFIVWSSIDRLISPQMPHVFGMFWLALLGVAVNAYAAWKISHGHTYNERALTWHMLEDLFGWVAVLVGSIVMGFYDVPWLDPVMSLVIAGFIILGASRSIWSSSQLFLQAAPLVDFDKIRSQILAVDGVHNLIDMRAWSLDGVHHVVSVHIGILPTLSAKSRSAIKQAVKDIFQGFGEFEVTLEFDERELS